MNNPILFYSDLCPDTIPFKQELERLNIEYEGVSIFDSMSNFKQFLKLRDNHSAFETAKKLGNIGIPALLLDNDEAILDKDKLQGIFR